MKFLKSYMMGTGQMKLIYLKYYADMLDIIKKLFMNLILR